MESKNYLEDLNEIKTMMTKSSRFISLSGLSGILAGIYALIGAAVAFYLVSNSTRGYLILDGDIFRICFAILLGVAFLSAITGIYLTTKKAKKNNEKIWDNSSKRLLFNFLIPLVAGGIYILIILNQERYGHTAALMLIFYGLALINASKYSLGDIRYLGITEIILGLICAIMPSFGFWFWVFGFGIMHIIYGAWMHYKYDLK
ncbi:hypothetical protein [Psychroserpens ponticola]|uniref:DUF308 domain-containing protein n=1 Tax=Psychroserpens ponticola TaxID=2932268 RepID=A0ABY7RUP9_9FLAO|nr:hypothetical protein [Psychroserpens ponticola]WCO00851.1 hypothetical protein MUN68_012330 [Psychroserpens ponticola]